VPVEDPVGVEFFHLLVGDLDPGGVFVLVEFSVHAQAGAGGGRGDVVIGAHRNPAGVVGQIVHTVRIRLAQGGIDEVMDLHLHRLTGRLPFPTGVLVGADEFFLLRVHTDHSIPYRQIRQKIQKATRQVRRLVIRPDEYGRKGVRICVR